MGSGLQMILLPLLLSDETNLPFVDLWSIGIILFSSGIVFLILAFIIRNIRNKRARKITADHIKQFKDDFQASIDNDKEN